MMNDKEMLKGLRTIVLSISALLMVITVIVQLSAYQAVLHIVLCSTILILMAFTLVFDLLLNDGKELVHHFGWFVLWCLNLLLNLFRFLS